MQSFEVNQLYSITTVLFSFILGANAFSYKEAKNWGKDYPECNGKNQSPAIIQDGYNDDIPMMNQTLKLTDFQKLPKKLTVTNTGHTVEIKADWSGEPPRCTGGPLHGNYVFEKTTFHWDKKRWSQLVLPVDPRDGNFDYKYDVEMIMFFYRADLKSFEKAEKQKGGLAAFKTGLQSNKQEADHLLDNLGKNLHKVQYPNSTTAIPPFRLLSYFDDTRPPYVSYEGSLEYPPCSESVTWFIDVTGYYITDGLVKEFKKIKLAGGDVSNIRPFQQLNNRPVKQVDYDRRQ